MPWSKYKHQCPGRVIQFIYRYCGLHIGEHVQIGHGDVTLYGEPFATYVWEEGEKNVPVFTFAPKFKEFQKIQEQRRAEVVEIETTDPWERLARKLNKTPPTKEN